MTAQKASDLSNHFLMAMPGLSDPNFDGTLVLLVEHSAEGAMGLVVNRPTELTLDALFEGIDLDLRGPRVDCPVLYGGPVHSDRGFVLHRPDTRFSSTIDVGESMALTSSRDILEAISAGSGPQDWLLTLGCSGWGAGQLEQELAENAWLSVQADPAAIFDTPCEARLASAYSLLGFDPTHLSGVAGHA